MTKLFGVDIASEINKAMGPGLLPLQLLRRTPGARTSGATTSGTNPTSKSYPCRGFTDSYSDSQFDGTLIRRGDRKVLILGASLPSGITPRPGDAVVVPSEGTYEVVGIPERDPAGATYVCQGRGT